jgi:hypothetical protein
MSSRTLLDCSVLVREPAAKRAASHVKMRCNGGMANPGRHPATPSAALGGPTGSRRIDWNALSTAITAITALAALVFTGLSLQQTRAQNAIAEQGQITDRYTRAVEQLASPTVEVRLGAIYALQRLAADSPRDRSTVRNVLAAFVRDHDLCTPRPPPVQCTGTLREVAASSLERLPTDVHAAFNVASSLAIRKGELADFSQVRYPRADLSMARLSGADLTGDDLTFAIFYHADLSFTTARVACLALANLVEADLRNADLRDADLYGAQLHGAQLKGADLRGADLRAVVGITADELRSVALTDQTTHFATAPLNLGTPSASSALCTDFHSSR